MSPYSFGPYVLIRIASFVIPITCVLEYGTTSNGFNSPPRGWNTWALQANPAARDPPFVLNQTDVLQQCNAMASSLGQYGYEYCSLDSGWSNGASGDENGRIIYNSSIFDLPALADTLHNEGLKLGIYILPGYFEEDANKTILGTNSAVQLASIGTGNCGSLARCDINYSLPAAQDWCNSNVDLWASWGVDLLKLDYVTPGSPDNGHVGLPADNSGSVICYHQAIAQSGRSMRLDISWKLERNDTYYNIWRANADSMRLDQDLNNYGKSTLVAWSTVQRAIEQYREYTLLQVSKDQAITIYPDMDNLLVGNSKSVTGLTDTQRQTMMTHWIGAGANLILGSDMTALDPFGLNLLTNKTALEIANFTAKYPMVPQLGNENPTLGQMGQTWLAGPDPDTRVAILIYANYGDNGNNGLFVFTSTTAGPVNFSNHLSDFGLSGSYNVENVWSPGQSFTTNGKISLSVDQDAVVFLRLTPTSNATSVTSSGRRRRSRFWRRGS